MSNPPSLSSIKINLTEITHISANLSEINIPQELKLHLQFRVRSHQPEEAYFYNTIMVLKQLALEDFDGIMFGQQFNTVKFPRTPIRLITKWGQIRRKYFVWALLLGLAFMTEETGLCVTSFGLLWQGVEIGGLVFGNPQMVSQAPETRSNGTASTTQKHVSSSDLTTSPANLGEPASDAGLSVNDMEVSVDIARSGGDLRKHDALMLIAGALAEAAEQPTAQRINHEWSSQLWNFECRFDTKQVTPIHSLPPIYTFRVLIESLAQVADYYVRFNMYHEVFMTTRVNFILVANSKLFQRRNRPLLGPGYQSTPVGSAA